MMKPQLIEEVLLTKGLDYGPVSVLGPLGGGSINEVLLISTSKGKMVLKTNSSVRFPGMFQAEADGLRALCVQGGPRIPQVILAAEMNSNQFLFLEYIEEGKKAKLSENEFAESLSVLHKCSAPHFGWPRNNYMGSL